MESILEVIKYIIPSLIVFISCVYIINRFILRDEKISIQENSKARQGITLPLRLQAYERLVMYLERINPENLIQRHQKNGMTAMALHAQLLQSVRSEFEHNLSQQIYVGEHCWLKLVLAKNEIIKMFNLCASQTSPNSPSMELSEKILNTYVNLPVNPLNEARRTLSSEVSQLF